MPMLFRRSVHVRQLGRTALLGQKISRMEKEGHESSDVGSEPTRSIHLTREALCWLNAITTPHELTWSWLDRPVAGIFALDLPCAIW